MPVGHPISTSSRLPAALLAVASASWLVLVVAAPYLVIGFRPDTMLWRVGGAVYFVGHLLCHQRADRSFHVWGGQLPVCGRCVGLYAGAVLGAFFAVPGHRRATATQARAPWRSRLIVAAVPTTVSLALEVAGVWTQTPAIRALAAVPLGFVVAWLVGRHAGVFSPVRLRV